MQKEQNLIKQGDLYEFTALPDHAGQRIDKFVTNNLTQYSRSFLHTLFEEKQILINKTKIAKPSYALKAGDIISISFPHQQQTKPTKDIPNDLGVEIIAKHDDFFVINKPAGLTVHPPHQTSKDVTLSDWLVKNYDDIAHVGVIDRPGIVHRLDKETSGLMLIPRTNEAHAGFTHMFKNRTIKKTYLAIVLGHPPTTGSIDYMIGRHPSVRNKMHYFTQITKQPSSRDAFTEFETIQYYKDFTLIKAMPKTGRTHQIRVHFAAIGFPILGDSTYGQKSKLLKRHALHAYKLEFEWQNSLYQFASPLDIELQEILNNAEKI